MTWCAHACLLVSVNGQGRYMYLYSEVQALQFLGHQITWASDWVTDWVRDFSAWASLAMEAAKETKFRTELA